MSQEHEHHHHDQTTHSDKEVEGKVLKDQVCPMHPEVLPDRSGSCPKCGMALEPNGGAALEYL